MNERLAKSPEFADQVQLRRALAIVWEALDPADQTDATTMAFDIAWNTLQDTGLPRGAGQSGPRSPRLKALGRQLRSPFERVVADPEATLVLPSAMEPCLGPVPRSFVPAVLSRMRAFDEDGVIPRRKEV